MGVGMLVLTQLDAGSSYWLLLAGILPVGAGMALATAPATTDIVAALPPSKQGVASAVNDAAREVGGTLGIAVLGSILNQQYRSGVTDAAPAGAPDGIVDGARESLAAALGIATHLGDAGLGLATGARLAFVDGMGLAFMPSAGVLFATAAVLLVAIPGRKDAPQAPHGHEEDSRTRSADLVDAR